MRVEWEFAPIGNICDVVNGGTPKTGVSSYWGGPHRWITPAEMGKRSTPYIDQTDRTITDQGIQNSSARTLPPYSVILSSRAPIGHLVINTEPMATNQGCKGLVPRGRIEYKFLYYYLGSIVELLNALGTGTTFKELSGGKLKEILVPVPPLAEQRRIIAVLDVAFEGIATAKKNAEQNLHNAGELSENQLRAVFSKRGSGWLDKPLGDLCELISGQHVDAEDYNVEGRGVAYLTGPSDFGRVYPVVTKWTEYPKKMARPGDILITVKGSGVGKINRLRDQEVAISRQLMAVRAAPEDADLLYAFLCTTFDHFQALANGAAIPGISRSDVLNLSCPLPPSANRSAIVELLRVGTEQAGNLGEIFRRKLKLLDDLKRSILHLAFTGAL